MNRTIGSCISARRCDVQQIWVVEFRILDRCAPLKQMRVGCLSHLSVPHLCVYVIDLTDARYYERRYSYGLDVQLHPDRVNLFWLDMCSFSHAHALSLSVSPRHSIWIWVRPHEVDASNQRENSPSSFTWTELPEVNVTAAVRATTRERGMCPCSNNEGARISIIT